ncbi:MAG: hypothetical protein COC04_00940 [Gammaproteobacteria bacterium]|nr:MAG: hypothetical protein COC04_00940 [Gammaproteobacteria bacterium]
MINENLNRASFYNERKSVQEAFGKYEIVTLPKGFNIFKLTKGAAEEHPKYGLSPWWSPVKPFKQDYEGALGRYQQAKLNKIDMSAMVRYMSAVCIDWNDLDNYVQVELTDSAKAYWGTFAPQSKFSSESYDLKVIRERKAQEKRVNGNAQLPNELGVLESWQLYIPNLKEEHVKRCQLINAHDMVALGMAFGFV